mgnify:CR=1 FL=1
MKVRNPFKFNRRTFLGRTSGVLGSMALAQLLQQESSHGAINESATHHPAKAK